MWSQPDSGLSRQRAMTLPSPPVPPLTSAGGDSPCVAVQVNTQAWLSCPSHTVQTQATRFHRCWDWVSFCLRPERKDKWFCCRRKNRYWTGGSHGGYDPGQLQQGQSLAWDPEASEALPVTPRAYPTPASLCAHVSWSLAGRFEQ